MRTRERKRLEKQLANAAQPTLPSSDAVRLVQKLEELRKEFQQNELKMAACNQRMNNALANYNEVARVETEVCRRLQHQNRLLREQLVEVRRLLSPLLELMPQGITNSDSN